MSFEIKKKKPCVYCYGNLTPRAISLQQIRRKKNFNPLQNNFGMFQQLLVIFAKSVFDFVLFCEMQDKR